MEKFIGIDPGSSSGCIAIIETDNESIININTFRIIDQTERELYQILYFHKDATKAFIERVSSMPGQGVSSSFTFGQNYGFLRACLIGCQISFENPVPTVWMKYYNMKRDKAETKDQWKKRLRQLAQQIFPKFKVDKFNADALLIANYCKKTYQ